MANISKIKGVSIANIAKIRGIAKANIASYGGVLIPASSFYSASINQSCRFEDGDGAYLSRTASGAGNKKTWTYSMWVKRGNLGTQTQLFSEGTGVSKAYLQFTGDRLQFMMDSGGASDIQWTTPATTFYRDVASWYHIVLAVDTTQATAADRGILYVNGVEHPFPPGTEPSLNLDTFINAGTGGTIGEYYLTGIPFDGYLAEVIFIDGTQYAATDFGEFKTGVWTPKAFSGSYGTNGFHLDFSVAAVGSLGNDLGKDVSGNGNHWTTNNLAATDQVKDSPTNNWCTLSPLEWVGSGGTQELSEGNLKLTVATTGRTLRSTFWVSSGKWYWEVDITGSEVAAVQSIGISNRDFTDMIDNLISVAGAWAYWAYDGNIYKEGVGSAYGATFAVGDTIGIAFDLDNGKLFFSKNGVWQNSGDPAAGTNAAVTGLSGTFTPSFSDNSSSRGEAVYANFGQDSTNVVSGNADGNGYGDFEYAPPSGFLALCSANLSSPSWWSDSEDKVDDGFNVVLYTGNASVRSITGVGHQPDMTVIKNRDQADEWKVLDSVRGATKELSWDSTNVESTDANGLTSFDSDGFSLGTGANGYNDNTEKFVSYNWFEGSTYGFHMYEFTGTGAAHAETHGAGFTPDVMIFKSETSANYWAVYHKDIGNTAAVYLNVAVAKETSVNLFNDTSPTSTQFTVGIGGDTNTSSATIITYLFDSIEGFSKFGGYTGNGNADGPFVYLGFRPAMLIIKRTDLSNNWFIFDHLRDVDNVIESQLVVDNTTAEDLAYDHLDMLSNGFKIRWSDAQVNASSGNYIFMAWAENPFKYANAR